MRTYEYVPIVEAAESDGRTVYPTAAKLGIQARQSTRKQAEHNKESYEFQTRVHYKRALRLGWVDTDILMFVENKRKDGTFKDASGTKRIDQRPTLQEMVWYIEHDMIKAVMTRGVDRLFRHEEMVEPALFAKMCKRHKCMVITDAYTYDFVARTGDTKKFLAEAQAGADFITGHIAMMHRYKREKSFRGEYDGRAIPVGYILDEDRLFYVVYEPHAQVVRWIFKRFRALGGNFVLLKREVAQKIKDQGYLFPFFDGPATRRTDLGRTAHGYTLTEMALRALLTNPTYIGWWMVTGVEDKDTERQRRVLHKRIEDNHPAIVSPDSFWYAFDRLSPTTIDGEKQPMEKTRYNKVGTVPVDALLNGIVKGVGHGVYVNQAASGASAVYAITDNTAHYASAKTGSITVKELDRIFTTHLLNKLQEGKELRDGVIDTPEEEKWLGSMDGEGAMAGVLVDMLQSQQVSTAGLSAQIAEYTAEAASLERTLHYGAKALDDKTIEAFAARLARLNTTLTQLHLKEQMAQTARTELETFAKRLGDVPEAWKDLGIEGQRRFIKLVTASITLCKIAPHLLQLEIRYWWESMGVHRCYILQSGGQAWTDAENTTLCQMYQHTDRMTILHALPTRSWDAIKSQALRLHIARGYQYNNSPYHRLLSVEDDRVMRTLGLPVEAPEPRLFWRVESIASEEYGESGL